MISIRSGDKSYGKNSYPIKILIIISILLIIIPSALARECVIQGKVGDTSKRFDELIFKLTIIDINCPPQSAWNHKPRDTIVVSLSPYKYIGECVEVRGGFDPGNYGVWKDFFASSVETIACPSEPRKPQTCTPGPIGSPQCSGNAVQQLYQDSNCNQYWQAVDDCNRYIPSKCCKNGACEKCGCQETYRCVDNVVQRLCIGDNRIENWEVFDDCNSYNPPRECIGGVCIPIDNPKPQNNCDQTKCQEQNRPVGVPYMKDSKAYQRYSECNCVDNKCQCQTVEKEVPFNSYKWYDISLGSDVYTLYVKTIRPISDPIMKPLSNLNEIVGIYIEDSNGNQLKDKILGKELIILAQSSARFENLPPANFAYPISSLGMHSEKRSDDKNKNYLILGPDATADWWRTLFIYKGIPIVLPGLDDYNQRVAKWKDVILDSVMQPDIDENPVPMQDLSDFLEKSGWSLEAIQDLNDANNLFRLTRHGNLVYMAPPNGAPSPIIFTNGDSNLVNPAVNEEFFKLLGIVSAVVSEESLILDIKADAWKKLLLHSLANGRAKDRLESLGVFINGNEALLDPALVEGYNEARNSFENEILKEYGNWEKDVLSEGVKSDKAVDLFFVTQNFASALGRNPNIARVWLPWFLSWEAYKYLRNNNENAQKVFLSSTLQSHLAEATGVKGLESLRKDLSTSDPKYVDKIENAINLYNMNQYLGYYFYYNYYEVLNDPTFKFLDDQIGGRARSDYMDMLQTLANNDKAICKETRHPQMLTDVNFFDWHDYSQLNDLFMSEP